ncbi:Bax inhibitor-1/YccA family protein [Streptomyces sp. NPDC051219]|uniref:Bax inhibitor-1/YccA family protein n=1 Tax=Streptomyces sp. NPDC051219 TaxID=3155283 RepID=UPI003419F19E
MKSSNPVFSRRGFSRGAGAGGNGEPAASGPVARVNPYAGVTSLRKGAVIPEGEAAQDVRPQVSGDVMTMDDVVLRTTLALGTVVLAAVLSWVLLPVNEGSILMSYGIAIGAALLAVALSLIQSFKSRPSPALILGYAAFEGVFLGVISNAVSTHISSGVVVQAVLGTMAVFAGVLIAYKLRWIRVTRRFYGFVMAAAVGFLLLTMANLLFSAFSAGDGLGFRSGGLGILFGIIGVILGASFLALHFKQVEDGITHGAPGEESWLAAFGLTLTLVWIYVEALRLLTLLQEDDSW